MNNIFLLTFLFYLSGFFNPLFAEPIKLYLEGQREKQNLCITVLVEEPEIKIAFLDGVKSAYEKRLYKSLGKIQSQYTINLQYGYSGLMNCLNPNQQFDRVFVLAHSMRVDENASALVYFQNVKTLKGEMKPYPYLVSQELLFKLKTFPNKKPLFIATCYPDGLLGTYPRLFPERNLESNSLLEQKKGDSLGIYLSAPDAVENSEAQIQSFKDGKQLLRLTSVNSALKLFADFLDFR